MATLPRPYFNKYNYRQCIIRHNLEFCTYGLYAVLGYVIITLYNYDDVVIVKIFNITIANPSWGTGNCINHYSARNLFISQWFWLTTHNLYQQDLDRQQIANVQFIIVLTYSNSTYCLMCLWWQFYVCINYENIVRSLAMYTYT